MTSRVPQIYEFGEFRVDTGKRLLLRAGDPVAMTPKVFETLVLLLRRSGELVEKGELMREVWPDTVVEENNLNQNISALRRLLGETRGEHRYIATLPGRGYCFTAEVRSSRASVEERGSAHVRIGVLPFENLGAGAEREYLADGLTEETIATLGQIDPEHFSVIGRTSVIAYKRTTKSLAEIGRELDAGYLIESSLRAEGERLRITSKLVRVRDELQIWSASFDSESRSLLKLQRELSIAIAEQVRLRLSPDRLLALAKRQTENADAYDLYLRGRYFWNQFTPQTTRKAVEYFTHATGLDGSYALAWSGLCDALCSSPVTGDAPPLGMLPRAQAAAEQAVRADPEMAEAQTSQGFFRFWLGWDWAGAEAAYRRALTMDANYAFGHRMMGILMSHLCRHDEARAAIQRARELDPLSSMNRALSSQVAFAGRDFGAAVEFAREAIVLDPEFWIGHFQLGQALVELGEEGPAFDALGWAGRLSGGNSKAMSLRGYLLARVGRHVEAREILKTFGEISRERYVPPYASALLHVGLGEEAEAMERLEAALAARDVHLVFLTMDAKWDPLRRDARFRDLLERCGFVHPRGKHDALAQMFQR